MLTMTATMDLPDADRWTKRLQRRGLERKDRALFERWSGGDVSPSAC